MHKLLFPLMFYCDNNDAFVVLFMRKASTAFISQGHLVGSSVVASLLRSQVLLVFA